MLVPPDAPVLKRDPDLPGLPTVLDARGLREKLRTLLAADHLPTPRITYVKYEPASFCRVGYQFPFADQEVQAYATAYRREQHRELEKARRRPSVSGPLGPGRIVLEDCAVVVSLFPNDRKISVLPAAADQQARHALLGEVVPDWPELWDSTIECLAYKPERRYVACLHGSQGASALLKVYSEKPSWAGRARVEAFAAGRSLRLAQCLGGRDHPAVIVLEWLSGQAVAEVIAHAHIDSASLTQVGAALAELHAQEIEGLPLLQRDAEAAQLHRVANALGFIRPSLGSRAQELARRLSVSLRKQPPFDRPLHGDFNPTQVLLHGAAVAILDLDRAVRGDPAFDLGNFLSYLEREAVCNHLPSDRRKQLAEAFLAGYAAQMDAALLTRLRLYTGAGLLRRLHPFRYWEPKGPQPDESRPWDAHWPHLAEAILCRAEALLAAPSSSS